MENDREFNDLMEYAERISGEYKGDERRFDELKTEIGQAELITNVRAYESSKNQDERICYDPLAFHFINPKMWEFLVEHPEMAADTEAGINSIVSRVRYFDDFLEKSLKEGLEQLIILGAGFDTRAYRINGLEDVEVFEVDHPDTQHFKVQKIKEIFGSIPENVVYVPIDFETEKIGENLLKKGYNSSLNTLFIMEGFIYYIKPEAVADTLSFIVKNSGKGSAVIFDYLLDTGVEEGNKQRPGANIFKFGIKEGGLKEFLSQFGFSEIKGKTTEDLKNLYYHGKNESRFPPSEKILHFAMATVE
jgi:methyltransferase (TIGR00027 family)